MEETRSHVHGDQQGIKVHRDEPVRKIMEVGLMSLVAGLEPGSSEESLESGSAGESVLLWSAG